MKIVITNAYTWYNKGDAGILLATIDVLKKIYKDPEISVLSFTPEEDAKRYCNDPLVKEVRSNILNPHPYKHTKIGKIIAMMKLVLKLIKNQLSIKCNFKKFVSKNRSAFLLSESDIIVVCGGGFLGGKKLDSLMHIYQIYVDTLFNKPVYIMGASIEPMKNKIVKTFTEKILKKVDYIFSRENITDEYLKSIVSDEKHVQIPDMAFALEEKDYQFEDMKRIREESDFIFGITVREWNFPQLKNKKVAYDNYIDSLANAMDYIIEKYNAYFVFIPQVIVEYGDDTKVAYKIKEKLNNNTRFVIDKKDYSPYEIKSLISKCDFFLGTRMHSNIFATSMCVPTVAIAYEKKTNGIMSTVKLDNYVIEIDTIKKDEIISKVDLMVKNKEEIIKMLKNEIPSIKKEIVTKINEKIGE